MNTVGSPRRAEAGRTQAVRPLPSGQADAWGNLGRHAGRTVSLRGREPAGPQASAGINSNTQMPCGAAQGPPLRAPGQGVWGPATAMAWVPGRRPDTPQAAVQLQTWLPVSTRATLEGQLSILPHTGALPEHTLSLRVLLWAPPVRHANKARPRGQCGWPGCAPSHPVLPLAPVPG